MFLSKVTIENFRLFGAGEAAFRVELRPGLTALVGENDSGKSAVVDALRFALGTTDQEWRRLEDSDFYREETNREIRITCKFDDLSPRDKRAFIEFLTYGDGSSANPVLFVHWTAKAQGVRRGRQYRQIELRSGRLGDGPTLSQEARDLLRATYLRPLRDAEQALTAGRGSRLSQVLHHSDPIRSTGLTYDPTSPADPRQLSVLGIGDLANDLLAKQAGITVVREQINANLKGLSLAGEDVSSRITVGSAMASEEVRLKHLLEKLDLGLGGNGRLGLGSNNLLFIACELLLCAQEDEGSRLLLIEEPEAHLDTQRQLRLMSSMDGQAKEEGIQILVTTHSPNLASAIPLDSMVMIRNGVAYPLAKGCTELDASDYRFLQRFLDVTKANLFFARGVLIVEGDAENILLPTLAELIGRDLAAHGVSIVNVGGVGLRRYARIFQRNAIGSGDGPGEPALLDIPVACVTDMDVMPKCAGLITGKKLKTKEELGEKGLQKRKDELVAKASGQCVRTFVSDQWTLEYDLAFAGLAEEVFTAISLAKKDGAIDVDHERSEDEREGKVVNTKQSIITGAKKQFKELEQKAREAVGQNKAEGCSYEEVLACYVYARFAKENVSKAIAAQYLADGLRDKVAKAGMDSVALQKLLPAYLVEAIAYVTRRGQTERPGANASEDDD